MYVYIESEPSLFTVGFYGPDDQWTAESDHTDSEDAAARVCYLNGGSPADSQGGAWEAYLNRKQTMKETNE